MATPSRQARGDFRNVLLHIHACTLYYYIYVRECERMGRNREYRRIVVPPALPRPPVVAAASSARDVRRWIHEYPSACPWKRVAETRPRDRRRTNPGDGERRDAGQCGTSGRPRNSDTLGSKRHPSTVLRAAAVRQLAGGAAAPMIAVAGG